MRRVQPELPQQPLRRDFRIEHLRSLSLRPERQLSEQLSMSGLVRGDGLAKRVPSQGAQYLIDGLRRGCLRLIHSILLMHASVVRYRHS